MRDCCPANQFSGCCEGRECTSKAVELGRFTKPTDRTLNTVLAKDRAGWAVRYGASIFIAVALISLSFITQALPESQRLTRAQQEQVAVK